MEPHLHVDKFHYLRRFVIFGSLQLLIPQYRSSQVKIIKAKSPESSRNSGRQLFAIQTSVKVLACY